ncbi:MAG: GLPGLI family protein [Saprospiraceae bacterium]|nr:GLPGLI family protein [Saprospiraceae bacterium]
MYSPSKRIKYCLMKRIILLSLFVIKSLLSNAQSIADYKIHYDFISISDTIKNEFLQTQEFILYRVEHESRFMPSAQYYNDSIGADFEKAYPQPEFKSQKEFQNYVDLLHEKVKRKPVRLNYKISKNFETGNFISLFQYSLPTQYIEEPMNFDWDITNEVDTILGLPCMKATTKYGGRNYDAWFTLAVPINDGPYVFQGLPGLILKITDDKEWYTFIVNNIVTEKTNRYWRPDFMNKFAQKIDRKTFVDKMIRQKENPPPIPGVLNFTEEDRLRLKERYAKRFDLLIEQY